MNEEEEIENHLLYISKKEAKSIQRFEIDMLGRSKERFTDFDELLETKSLENKIKNRIDSLR